MKALTQINTEQLSAKKLYNASEALIIKRALVCLEERLKSSELHITNNQAAEAYLRLQLAQEEAEVFGVIFLNSQNGLMSFEKLFFGTITHTHIYPRRVVQRALAINAAAVILTHNHPSGNLRPSQADIELTQKLKDILAVVDVAVLDHLIVSVEGAYSFAKYGLI